MTSYQDRQNPPTMNVPIHNSGTQWQTSHFGSGPRPRKSFNETFLSAATNATMEAFQQQMAEPPSTGIIREPKKESTNQKVRTPSSKQGGRSGAKKRKA